MLLSPLGSPSNFKASLCLPLSIVHDDRLVADDVLDIDIDSDGDDDESDDSDDLERVEPPNDLLALPVELILAIIELCTPHRRTALALSRVSSWVRAAVLPALYGTLSLHGNVPTPFDLIAGPCEFPGSFCGVGEEEISVGYEEASLVSPLRYIRSLWLDVPPHRAPRSLDSCPRLKQLALPLEAHATISQSKRWLALESGTPELEPATRCTSFTVLGQSHPHRWAPLTSSPEGRAFLRGVTHLRLLNLCLSHYIPLEYTPNLTHLCLPFFDLRIASATFLPSAPTGSAASSSFTGLDYILAQPSLQMVVLTLNPRYWRFDELSLKGWAVRAMARDPRLYVVAATRDDATRDWDVPKRDWEDEAAGGMSVWDKAVMVRRKFLTRLSRSWDSS